MRKFSSFLLVCLAILSMALKPTEAKASHAAGGEIIYQWISDSTYRIFFKFYRDCTGIDASSSENLCITNTCTGVSQSLAMDKWNQALPGGGTNGDPVSAGCSQYKNKCEDLGSAIPGYREWWYYKIVTLTGKCDNWVFSVSVSARNTSINMGGGNLYVETALNNLTNPRGDTNSSPFFSIKPIPYVCQNQPFTYNNGAIDPDGDSLVTDIINPLDGGCGSAPTAIALATKTPALSIPTNPFQTNNTFITTPSTGQMSFTAAEKGAQTLSTRVREYRNGILIGYIMRDVQVQVLECTTTAPTFDAPPASILGGTWMNNRVNGCIDQLLEFDFNLKGSDTDLILIAEDNHAFSMPTANITYNNQKTDSVWGHFAWTPTKSGLFGFLLTVKDSTCKPPGIMLYYVYSIPIYVWPPVETVPDTSVCPGQTAFLNAIGGGNYQWSVLPGGDPITSLNNPNVPNPIALPKTKTTYVVTSTLTNFCNNNKDTVTVDVLPGLNFTPIPDAITCPDNPVTLDLKTMPPSGTTYNVKWNTSLWLSDSTSSAPVSTPKSTLTYTVILSSNANRCQGFDTVMVDVLTGFKIDNPDTAICQGQSVQVRINADPRYTFLWESEDPVPGVVVPSTSADPLITPKTTDTFFYRLKASYPGCKDSVAGFFIDLQPIPTVTVDADASMCEGDTMKLNGIVTPADYKFDLTWTPGASLDNPKIAKPIFAADKTTTLTLTATSTAGCTDNDDVTLTVFPAEFVFPTGDTAICPGATTQLHMTGNGLKSFRWYPEFGISDVRSADPTVNPTSTQVYSIVAIDTNACFDTAVVKVIVNPKPTVYLPDEVTIYPGESYQMDPEGNAAYYSWFPPVGLSNTSVSNPVAKPDVNTRYFVTATTETGCTAVDSINVLVDVESVISLPNAFSPGSNPNAVFKILRRGDANLKSFTIFNRWGAKVFETSDINQGWDGQFKNEPQPMGVYIYVVEGTAASGRKFTKQGNVTLIR